MFLSIVAATLLAQDWQAGAAKVDITPQGPIWMAGYAARTKPSQGVLAPIHAKALAIDDGRKGRVVFVTTDIIGFPKSVAEEIAIAALKRYKLDRHQLVLNSSHTHSGPVIWPNLATMYFFSPEEQAKVEAYTRNLVTQVSDLIGAAIGNLKPSKIDYGLKNARFAVHRRNPTPEGIKNAPHPTGPTDHAVPVISVKDASGKPTAILFSYSCHNTTMTGEFYQINGDYAGFAQAEVEARQPGAIALFATACAGDQNPYPRSALEHAKAHGHELAQAVLATQGAPLKGRIKSRFQMIDLPFQAFGPNDFEKALKSSNKYEVRRAENLLKSRPSHQLAYPIQAIRLGQANIVTLGGEVVVDYCLRLRKETNDPKLIVLGHSSDVMCYIPTAKQVEEGGYEANESFLYYGQPAPLKGETENIIIDRVRTLLKGVQQ